MWPFTSRREPEPEKRQAQPFTDAVVSAIAEQAGGSVTGDPSGIAALETSAGIYSRAFAVAVPSPPEAARALTPAVLALIARDLIRRGESVHVIDVDVDMGGTRLVPAGSWDVRGGPDEALWWYRADVFGPSGNVTVFRPGQAVAHCRYAVDPSRPWHGVGPLAWARLTGTLAANLETRLGEEAGASAGHVIPVPAADPPTDDGPDRTKQLAADLRTLRGKSVLVETSAAGWGEGRVAAPQADWKPQRIGANPPAGVVSLRSEAAAAVLSACGVPPSLVSDKDGSGQRESWRRFLHGSLMPVAELVAAELAVKLGIPGLSLSFDRLFASDLSGRARAFQSMVNGGLDVAQAAALSGLMTEDA